MTSIELVLMQIAQANNAPQEANQSARSVLKWISQRTKWLMIYDGADGDYQVVETFFPPGNGGNILITSRSVELKRISLTSFKVLNMAEEEAATLLLKSAALDGMTRNNSNIVRRLASELIGIPLALDQAGAFMLTTQYSGFKGASDYATTTYGTWDIPMQKIEKMVQGQMGEEAGAAQSAIKILRNFAFLHHANIPEALFKNAAEN
ncbi:hypothetical protein AX14_000683 [Amanita brunnescens Koide BX004]|nr:hypothetical protein AX14_000683 [Amanita brunnescens Koide BX004]